MKLKLSLVALNTTMLFSSCASEEIWPSTKDKWPILCPVPLDTYDNWSETRCPASSTCSPNGFSAGGGYGCCPGVNSVSCDSGFACCPENTTCSLLKGEGYSSVYQCLDPQKEVDSISLCPCKPGMPLAPSTTLKNVLIIGDSLSIGFTPLVNTQLADVALVQHAPWDTSDGGAEESRYFEQCLDSWVRSPSGILFYPDVIYFNSGMHNLGVNTTIEEGTSVNGQAGNTTEYYDQMDRITKRLVEFAAQSGGKTKLLYGLTTPYLCTPETDDIINLILNAGASKIMGEQGVPTVNTYGAIVDKCGNAPVANCFGVDNCYCPHCGGGYDFLANEVIAPAIRAALE